MKARHHIALTFVAALAAGALVSHAFAAPEGLPAEAAAVEPIPVETTQAVPPVVTPAPRVRSTSKTPAVRQVRAPEQRIYSYNVDAPRPSCNSILCSGRFILVGVGF